MAPRAAYVHVPFCRRRCGYCSFTVVAGRGDLETAYLEAIDRELAGLGQPQQIDTLFLGGGTPTQLTPDGTRRLAASLRRWFVLAADGEFTAEANPEDLSDERLELLREAGVNRISLGLQSLDDGKLARLDRQHRRREAIEALRRARARFPSLAVDLIFAVPGETAAVWQADLDGVAAAGVDHVSAYGLTYEKGAACWSALQRGRLKAIEENAERAMYEMAIDTLAAAGFQQYEVSNFARPGHRCRHNETYWLGHEYYAFGPGASRYLGGWRSTNHRSTTAYLNRVLSGRSPVAEQECLPPEARARERLVFQLRMLDGVPCDGFRAGTGWDPHQLLGELRTQLIAWGLLEDLGDRLRLTREGLMVSDAIFGRILSATPRDPAISSGADYSVDGTSGVS